MDAAGALADWVGAAAAGSEEAVQRAVVQAAFGVNAARSVPEMGKHSSDDDAREALGPQLSTCGICLADSRPYPLLPESALFGRSEHFSVRRPSYPNRANLTALAFLYIPWPMKRPA